MDLPPVIVTAAALVASSLPGRALAGADGEAVRAYRPPARELVGTGLFLTGVEPAAANELAADAAGVAGFDGARRTPVLGARAEVAVTRWLALRAGVTYTPGERSDDRSVARPHLAVRANLLGQARAGVDLSLAAAYRQERFAGDGGLFDLTAAVGRRAGRLALIANLGAAADPEGDDFEGRLGAAALVRATPALHLGAQGFVRRDLGSTDPRRALRNDSIYDFAAGPVASYGGDTFVFTLQAGVVGVRASERAIGLLTLGAVGAVF